MKLYRYQTCSVCWCCDNDVTVRRTAANVAEVTTVKWVWRCSDCDVSWAAYSGTTQLVEKKTRKTAHAT